MPGNRPHAVAIRLDDDELARWKAAAAEGGRLQLARWVRETVEEALAGIQPQPDRASHFAATLRQQSQALQRIGRELERLADGSELTPATLARLEQIVMDAKQLPTSD